MKNKIIFFIVSSLVIFQHCINEKEASFGSSLIQAKIIKIDIFPHPGNGGAPYYLNYSIEIKNQSKKRIIVFDEEEQYLKIGNFNREIVIDSIRLPPAPTILNVNEIDTIELGHRLGSILKKEREIYEHPILTYTRKEIVNGRRIPFPDSVLVLESLIIPR